ncbi:MAG: hypothetical protein JSV62_04050 [Promethearchaeota archaeon]|nr:MAG: hypothetical protein JSV62_04050 [Candidatus Lokiarchaeota archaeon]
MEELDKLDKRFRNIAVIIIIISVLLLTISVLLHLTSSENVSPILLSISIALLLAGILLFTRIQYVMLMKKRV